MNRIVPLFLFLLCYTGSLAQHKETVTFRNVDYTGNGGDLSAIAVHTLLNTIDSTEVDVYLKFLLSDYTKADIDLTPPAKVDSPELILKWGLIDSVLLCATRLGTTDFTGNSWISSKFAKTFMPYYEFQKSLYGNLTAVSIRDVYCSVPYRKKAQFPRFYKVKADVETTQGKGAAEFEYYQLGPGQFRFHRFKFYPNDYEKIGTVDSLARFFYTCIEQKQYELLFESFTPYFKMQIVNKKRFMEFMASLNLTATRQVSSAIKYDDTGLSLLAYYDLSEQKNYLLLSLKKTKTGMVIDNVNLIAK